VTVAPDLLDQINNAVLDIQSASYQTYERPLKVLGRLLKDPQLTEVNASLTQGLDLEVFLARGNRGHGMVGSAILEWPDDPRELLGLSLMLVEKCAAEPNQLLQIAHHYYHAGNNFNQELRSITARLIIPFARDYKLYVQSHGNLTPVLSRKVSKRVFVVHGHDDAMRETVARFLSKVDLEPVILHEQANKGRTVIEKVEANSDVGFAVILLSPDDEGRKKGDPELEPRARQNVLLELGYFLGHLGRERVCALRRGQVSIPSDFAGVVWEAFDDNGGWKLRLGKELEAAGYQIDWKKVAA